MPMYNDYRSGQAQHGATQHGAANESYTDIGRQMESGLPPSARLAAMVAGARQPTEYTSFAKRL